VRQFPTSAKANWGGLPALAAPNDVLVLFSRVATAPATSPQTAVWHFGWHVTDARASLESYTRRPDVTLLPLYTFPLRARAQAQARPQGAEIGVHHEGRLRLVRLDGEWQIGDYVCCKSSPTPNSRHTGREKQ